MAPAETAYFVQISDTHFGPSPSYSRHGHTPLPCAKRLVEIINGLPVQPDFVIHTGDIVTNPDARAYNLAAEVFSELVPPIYYVTGNHDASRDIHRYLPMGPKKLLSNNPDELSYVFETKGYRFMVLDARGPDEIDPHGLMTEATLALVREEVAQGGPPLVLFMHYPIHPMNSIWMDAYMLTIDGEKLHEALLPARDRLRAVFHGHVHQNMQTVRDGILYVAVGSTFAQFTAWPTDVTVGYDPTHDPTFNFVHVMPEQTIVHQHTFPRPK